MAILFPTSIDSLSNPVGSDQVANANPLLVHSTQHSNANDAIEALESKVGITNSLVTITHDYKLQGVSGSDKASSITGTETLTNKTLTAPKIVNNGFIADANGNEQIEMVTTASAVNNVRVTNAATGNSPVLDVNGSDSNIDLSLKAKGSGNVKFGTANIKLPNVDGSNGDVLTTNGTGVSSWGSAASSSDITLTAGEALTAGNAVMIADGTESVLLSATSTTNSIRETQTLIYQSFTTGSTTTSIRQINMWIDTNGGAATLTVTLRATPSGSDMFTPVSTGTINASQEYAFTITGGVTVSPNTTYYIIGTGTFKGGTTSSYSGGVSAYWNGSAWVTPAPIVTGDFYFKVFETYTVAGRVYKTSADNVTYVGTAWTTNFLGFAKTTVASLASVGIQVLNIYTGLSGLTTGLTYYLSNTQGTIASSAGTVSKKVGVATSSTNLFIRNDN